MGKRRILKIPTQGVDRGDGIEIAVEPKSVQNCGVRSDHQVPMGAIIYTLGMLRSAYRGTIIGMTWRESRWSFPMPTSLPSTRSLRRAGLLS
jgi:hypothetical protein